MATTSVPSARVLAAQQNPLPTPARHTKHTATSVAYINWGADQPTQTKKWRLKVTA